MNELFIQRLIFDWKSIEKNSYLRNIKSLKKVKTLDFDKSITFFAGENASGNSTLLEAIAINYGFNPEGGTKNYNFSTQNTHSNLYDAIKISKGYRKAEWGYFFRAESFYNVASKEEEYSNYLNPSKGYHKQSHGESFISLIQNNLKANSLYLFDEPEASLSTQNQLTFLREIYKFAKEGCQFIIVSHSPILLATPKAQIFNFNDSGIYPYNYEETDSYKLTELFINNKDKIINELLKDL